MNYQHTTWRTDAKTEIRTSERHERPYVEMQEGEASLTLYVSDRVTARRLYDAAAEILSQIEDAAIATDFGIVTGPIR